MKVLITVFGNPDSALTLSKHLSEKAEVTLMLVASGDKFRQGVLNIDLRNTPAGLLRDAKEVSKYMPEEIMNYADGSFRLWLLKTPSSVFVHSGEGLVNYRIIKESSKIINEEKFDVVHYSGSSGFLLYMLKYFTSGKSVWSLHDYKSHTGGTGYPGDLLNKMYDKFLINHVQHTNYLRKEFIKYFEVREETVDTVYTGVYDVYNSFKPRKIRLPQKYILFFGRIQKYKGIELLVDAFDRVKYELNDHKLVIAGDGKIPDEILSKDNILCINRYITPQELVHLVTNAKFVIVPYTEVTYSGVLMTAYNFGRPVVASSLGSMPEIVINGKTGVIFRNGDVDDLADQIYNLCSSEEKIDEMSAAVNDYVKTGKINWDSVVSRVIEVYEKKILPAEIITEETE